MFSGVSLDEKYGARPKRDNGGIPENPCKGRPYIRVADEGQYLRQNTAPRMSPGIAGKGRTASWSNGISPPSHGEDCGFEPRRGHARQLETRKPVFRGRALRQAGSLTPETTEAQDLRSSDRWWVDVVSTESRLCYSCAGQVRKLSRAGRHDAHSNARLAGTGRRTVLKIRRPQGRPGSNPGVGTRGFVRLVELVDTHGRGPCALRSIRVQVPGRALSAPVVEPALHEAQWVGPYRQHARLVELVDTSRLGRDGRKVMGVRVPRRARNTQNKPRSFSGPGRRPFTALAPVRIRSGVLELAPAMPRIGLTHDPISTDKRQGATMSTTDL